MSQNPFAAGNHDSFQPQSPQKTSGLAIAALICSLIFCIPGLALIGLILGIIAIVVIGGSEGRVKGKGLATAAVIISLIVGALWVGGIVIGFRVSEGQRTQMQQPTYSAFTKLDAGDVSEFRALLAPNVKANITDAEILAFRDAYKEKVGTFQGEPQDFKSIMAMASVLKDGSLIIKLQQTASVKGVMPLPAAFSKLPGTIVIASDTIKSGMDYALATPTFVGTVVDIAVATPNQPAIFLSDFIGKKALPAPNTKPPAPAGNGG